MNSLGIILVASPMNPHQLSTITRRRVEDHILYVEGSEATQPFDGPIPLDAISVAIIDNHEFDPPIKLGTTQPKIN